MSAAVDELLWQAGAAFGGIYTDAVTEYPFAKSIGRRWRFDLAYPSRRVAVEVDGGAFVGGRHVTGTGFEADAEKLSTAASMGWRVLRFTPRMIRDGKALTLLLAALDWRDAA